MNTHFYLLIFLSISPCFDNHLMEMLDGPPTELPLLHVHSLLKSLFLYSDYETCRILGIMITDMKIERRNFSLLLKKFADFAEIQTADLIHDLRQKNWRLRPLDHLGSTCIKKLISIHKCLRSTYWVYCSFSRALKICPVHYMNIAIVFKR